MAGDLSSLMVDRIPAKGSLIGYMRSYTRFSPSLVMIKSNSFRSSPLTSSSVILSYPSYGLGVRDL